MKWILIITLFGADGVTKVSYTHPTEAVCEQAGKNYMASYAAEGAKAAYECESDVVDFVVPSS